MAGFVGAIVTLLVVAPVVTYVLFDVLEWGVGGLFWPRREVPSARDRGIIAGLRLRVGEVWGVRVEPDEVGVVVVVGMEEYQVTVDVCRQTFGDVELAQRGLEKNEVSHGARARVYAPTLARCLAARLVVGDAWNGRAGMERGVESGMWVPDVGTVVKDGQRLDWEFQAVGYYDPQYWEYNHEEASAA